MQEVRAESNLFFERNVFVLIMDIIFLGFQIDNQYGRFSYIKFISLYSHIQQIYIHLQKLASYQYFSLFATLEKLEI